MSVNRRKSPRPPDPSPVAVTEPALATGVKPFSKDPVADRIRPALAGTKIATIIDLIARKEGAMLDEFQAMLAPKSRIRTVLNAFYELGVRHVCQLPTIQLIQKGDKIPFDVAARADDYD